MQKKIGVTAKFLTKLLPSLPLNKAEEELEWLKVIR
jgi:hypothetical protein